MSGPPRSRQTRSSPQADCICDARLVEEPHGSEVRREDLHHMAIASVVNDDADGATMREAKTRPGLTAVILWTSKAVPSRLKLTMSATTTGVTRPVPPREQRLSK